MTPSRHDDHERNRAAFHDGDQFAVRTDVRRHIVAAMDVIHNHPTLQLNRCR
jgi:hypothetical protein